jgi:Pyridoxamine 5'-phosphate oxidase
VPNPPDRPTDSFVPMLPEWPPGTVTILATAGETPHAIPVSAAIRAGPRHVLIGLAAGRGSLARLRADPRVALAIIAEDLAVTARGRARVLDDALIEGVVAVEIEIQDIQDHDRPTFAIDAGVRWRWTDPEAQRRDAAVHTALAQLAERRGAPRLR